MEHQEHEEHEDVAARAEAEAEDLERQGDRVNEHIQSARDEWDRKKADPNVPGARPDEGEGGAERHSGAASNPDSVAKAGQ